jgi:hypothetical protein
MDFRTKIIKKGQGTRDEGQVRKSFAVLRSCSRIVLQSCSPPVVQSFTIRVLACPQSLVPRPYFISTLNKDLYPTKSPSLE